MRVHVRGRLSVQTRRRAFTITELLVAVGVIAILLGILLPAVARARLQCQCIRCSSNIRQIVIALTEYAADYGMQYPPNTTSPAPGQAWCDADRIGRYVALPIHGVTRDSMFVCPNDDNSNLSFSMNFWASSQVDLYYPRSVRQNIWGARTMNSSQLLLVVESWSGYGSYAGGFSAPSCVGYAGQSEGQRFGGAGGLGPPLTVGRWGQVNCELPYMRHRDLSDSLNTGKLPHGRVAVAYADGHAEIVSDADLVNASTGLSSGRAIWYLGDPP